MLSGFRSRIAIADGCAHHRGLHHATKTHDLRSPGLAKFLILSKIISYIDGEASDVVQSQRRGGHRINDVFH